MCSYAIQSRNHILRIAFSDIDTGRIVTKDAPRVAVTEATRSGLRDTFSLTGMAVSEAMPSIAASYAQRSNTNTRLAFLIPGSPALVAPPLRCVAHVLARPSHLSQSARRVRHSSVQTLRAWPAPRACSMAQAHFATAYLAAASEPSVRRKDGPTTLTAATTFRLPSWTGADTAVMPGSTASSRTATPSDSTLPASAAPTAEARRGTRWPSQLTWRTACEPG